MRRKEPDRAAVKLVQQALVQLGYPLPASTTPGGLDGDFGQETLNAVLRFQGDKGLSRDGEVGRDTLNRMDVLLATGALASGADPRAVAQMVAPIARFWVNRALSTLTSYTISQQTGIADALGDNRVTIEAIDAHFHLDRGAPEHMVSVRTIQDTFNQVNFALMTPAVFFAVDDATAASDFGQTGNPTFVPPPAYAMARDSALFRKHGMFFTSAFKTPRVGESGFGPNCLAAMVLHESVHFVDRNAPDFAYEHQKDPFVDTPLNQFIPGADYDRLPPEKAIHNPSSYACFAAHVFKRFDEPRYGAGNPSL